MKTSFNANIERLPFVKTVTRLKHITTLSESHLLTMWQDLCKYLGYGNKDPAVQNL
jgi:hypothetical protein